ncbi:MAG: hypothetical protein K2M04_04085 [Muribaculaceae bacterium]|nr:hypothetical protein [Muribaculaceae bacterium]
MEQYFQTGLGILVSVVLFLMGYKQTIGAKKERIKSADKILVDTLLKRIILEDYSPSISDIDRLKQGLARDYKVDPADLLPVDIIYSLLFTRIFENDLISKEQRNKNLGRLIIAINNNQKSFDRQFSPRSDEKGTDYLAVTSLLLGGISVLIGTTVSFFDSVFTKGFDDINMILITVGASITLIFIAYLFIKIKNNQEGDISVRNSIHQTEAIRFEEKVISSLNKNRAIYSLSGVHDPGWDITVKLQDILVAVDIKYWKRKPSSYFVKDIIDRFHTALKKSDIEKGYILVNDTYYLQNTFNDANIEIITLPDFIKILKNTSSN